MDRRLLTWAAAVSALLLAVGLLGADHALAQWIHVSGMEHARVFAWGLGALDVASGLHAWYWLAGWVVLTIGLVTWIWRRRLRWPRALIVAACIQFACIATMIVGKNYFGRLRPEQVFASGDWSHLWFVGGGSFPSGHSAFYFGLLLPLAAACTTRWGRVLLVAIPVYVALARMNLAKHFLSDVAASALMAALYGLLVATATRRWLTEPQ